MSLHTMSFWIRYIMNILLIFANETIGDGKFSARSGWRSSCVIDYDPSSIQSCVSLLYCMFLWLYTSWTPFLVARCIGELHSFFGSGFPSHWRRCSTEEWHHVLQRGHLLQRFKSARWVGASGPCCAASGLWLREWTTLRDCDVSLRRRRGPTPWESCL